MGKRRSRGEGGLEQLPSGSFRAVVSLGVDNTTGKRVRLTFTHPDRKRVLDWKHEQQVLLSAGRLSADGRMPLSDWLTRWLALKGQQIEAATRKWYEGQVEGFIRPRLGTVRLCDLDAARVGQWYAKMAADKVPAGQQRRAGTALRTILSDAHAAGLVTFNAAKRVKLPKHRAKESHSFTQAEVAALLAHLPADWFGVYVQLGLDTGMRPGELLALHWEDVSTAEGWVRVRWSVDGHTRPPALKPPKTAKGRRVIRIGEPAKKALEGLWGDGKATGELVFRGRFGGLRSVHNVSKKRWKPLLKAAGLASCGPYTLRHTSATLLLASGVSIRVVSEMLGHADIATTLRHYAHAIPADLSRLVEAKGRIFRLIPTPSPRATAEQPSKRRKH